MLITFVLFFFVNDSAKIFGITSKGMYVLFPISKVLTGSSVLGWIEEEVFACEGAIWTGM
jgi:hypothetical protein